MDTSKLGLVDIEKKALADAFKAIHNDITGKDRAIVAKKQKLNLKTVYRYTSGEIGEIRDTDRAHKILDGLKECIAFRKQKVVDLQQLPTAQRA